MFYKPRFTGALGHNHRDSPDLRLVASAGTKLYNWGVWPRGRWGLGERTAGSVIWLLASSKSGRIRATRNASTKKGKADGQTKEKKEEPAEG